jgi:membrane fusion protein (multidrug efflux system)
LGDIVERGQVLATLHTSLLDAALIEAEAGAKFQRYNHRKSKQLFADGTISERDLFQAEYDFKRAESNLTTVTQRLTNSTLQAPFSGTIAGREIEVGRLVGPSQPAIHLVQWDKVKMRAWISESEVADFVPGREVDAHVDAVRDKVFTGSVGRVGPSADAKRRVFPIEVHIDNENGDLRPGMVGKLTIRRRTFENVVVIPREAVVERETGPGAFVVDGDRVAYRSLELGEGQGNRVIALSGLKSGERVIVSGGRDLINGDRVLVKETHE